MVTDDDRSYMHDRLNFMAGEIHALEAIIARLIKGSILDVELDALDMELLDRHFPPGEHFDADGRPTKERNQAMEGWLETFESVKQEYVRDSGEYSIDESTRIWCASPSGLMGNPSRSCLYREERGRLFAATFVVYREGEGGQPEALSEQDAEQLLNDQGHLRNIEPLGRKEAIWWLQGARAPKSAYAAAGLELEND